MEQFALVFPLQLLISCSAVPLYFNFSASWQLLHFFWGVGSYRYFALIFFFLLDSCDVNSIIFRWCVASATNYFPFHVAFLTSLIIIIIKFFFCWIRQTSHLWLWWYVRPEILYLTKRPTLQHLIIFFLRGHIFFDLHKLV